MVVYIVCMVIKKLNRVLIINNYFGYLQFDIGELFCENEF